MPQHSKGTQTQGINVKAQQSNPQILWPKIRLKVFAGKMHKVKRLPGMAVIKATMYMCGN